MATKKSTPGTRSRRNPSNSPAASASTPASLHDHIEHERSRLMDAETVLDCIAATLEEDERMDLPGPYYPRALRIARDIVQTTIDQLDSVNVKAAMAASVSAETPPGETEVLRKYDGVKEAPSEYVH